MDVKVLLLCLVLIVANANAFRSSKTRFSTSQLYEIYKWKTLQFDRNDSSVNYNKIFPLDTDVYYGANGNRTVFVTVPRYLGPSPVTLGVVTNSSTGKAIIAPFPSYDWQSNVTSCNKNRIISVFRIQVDECGRLWVLDTGIYLGTLICPPQILAFDIKTHNLLHQYEIPAAQYEQRSQFVTPIVDVRDSCTNTFVYIADCNAYAMVVHDVQKNTSWKIVDKTFYPYPSWGYFDIAGDTFDLMDGLLGMALTPYKAGSERYLFFHALASTTENWVKTSDLRNSSLFINDPGAAPYIFHTYKGHRFSQSAVEAIDSNGTLFYGSLKEITINCFKTTGEYGSDNSSAVVANNSVTLQFPTGMKVITNPSGAQELWSLTSRFQKFMTSKFNASEVNFRIMNRKTADLVAGTHCS